MSVFTGKKVLVLGGGISGAGVSRVLAGCGAKVVLSDGKLTKAIAEAQAELRALGVQIQVGVQSRELLNEIDLVVLSPGISLFSALPQMAIESGIEVISEVEVAHRIANAPILAVTGTNGKTTTTTLLGRLLAESGCATVVGGNIGAALSLEIAQNPNADVVVAEISSYQLEAAAGFCPVIAAILNVTPDHLERHGTMQEYFAAKSKIFAHQSSKNYLILNYDDELLRTIKQSGTRAKIIWFSRKAVLKQGVYVKEGQIIISLAGKPIELMPIANLKLIGNHNVENVLAAVACAYLFGANLTAMQRVLSEFSGVEHRLEFVRRVGDVDFYNDSKSTNPESTIPALNSFERPIVLLAGGKDKNTPLDEMMEIIKNHNTKLVLFGEAAGRFKTAAEVAGVEVIKTASDLEEALKIACSIVDSGEIVLLSPACASYDQYDNFEQRGEHFKKLVNEME